MLTLDPDLGLVVLEVRRPTRHGLGPSRAPFCTRVRRSPTPSTGRCGTRPTCADCIRVSYTSSTTRSATIAVGCYPSPTSKWCSAERLESRFADTTRLVPVDAPGRLPYDHDDIIDARSRPRPFALSRQAGPGRAARRRVHTSRPAARARGDRRDGRCSATPSDVRWSRNSSRLATRRSAPEGVRRMFRRGSATQSRLGERKQCRCLVAFTGVDEMASRAGRIQGCGG